VSSMVELSQHLAYLAGAFGKPFGAKTADQMLRGWYQSRQLRELPDSAVSWAVQEHIGTGKKFPVPAEIIALAKRAPTMGVVARRDEIPSDRRCPECLEWWGWHRLVVTRANVEPALVIRDMIRHTAACSETAFQTRWAHFYGYSWVDGAPDVGQLEEGGEAWKCDGVQQLIHPLPPRAGTPKPKEPKPESRSPYPKPKAPEQLAGVVPGAQKQLAAGEYVEPVEELR
jgi:hypothetical protein